MLCSGFFIVWIKYECPEGQALRCHRHLVVHISLRYQWDRPHTASTGHGRESERTAETGGTTKDLVHMTGERRRSRRTGSVRKSLQCREDTHTHRRGNGGGTRQPSHGRSCQGQRQEPKFTFNSIATRRYRLDAVQAMASQGAGRILIRACQRQERRSERLRRHKWTQRSKALQRFAVPWERRVSRTRRPSPGQGAPRE